jgi:hypothetical protein
MNEEETARARGRTLVAGWFSFEEMGATAGDLLAKDVACEWLRQAGHAFDVAYAPPFAGGVDWRAVDPARYTHVVFVCGPFGNGEPITVFLQSFPDARLIGLNLTMLEPLDVWNPFDLLIERDSSAASHPDLSFLSRQTRVPVVGVVLIHPQPEYGKRDLHAVANGALGRLIASHPMAAVPIDTRLDQNGTGLRSAAEVESLIARMDVVLTTRLHGTVLALKNGVPAIAIDPVAGGAKITRQAQTLGWPLVFAADAVTDDALEEAFGYCLTDQARAKARDCAECAVAELDAARERFLSELGRLDSRPAR